MLRSFAIFLPLAYGLSWAIWGPLVWASPGAGGARSYLHLVGALGPAIGALIAVGFEGREAWRAFIAQLDPRRAGKEWLALAVLGPLALYGIAVLIYGTAAQSWPRWSDFGASKEYSHLGRTGYWVATIFFYGYGEEIGWRGYLLPRLQMRYRALSSALVVSVIWALWHLPLFWFAAGMSAMGPAEIAGWFFSIVTGSILMTWLFNSSGGSITAVALFHGVLDIVMTSPGPAAISTIMGAAITLWGIAVVFIAGPTHLARRQARRNFVQLVTKR